MEQTVGEMLRALDAMLHSTHHTHGTDNQGAKIELRRIQADLAKLAEQVKQGQCDAQVFADLRHHVASLKINEPRRFESTLAALERLMTAAPASGATSGSERP